MPVSFKTSIRKSCNDMILATALRKIREAKWNVPTLMPFTEDVQKMHTYLSQVQDQWYKSLSESSFTKAWMELAKVCLAQIILFNRHGEERWQACFCLRFFFLRDTSDPHEDVDWALSEVEKKLCRHFSRIIIRGKHGRPVPILLTPKMLCALELLVKQREPCGVLKDNAYMFARPEAMKHFRGSDCFCVWCKVSQVADIYQTAKACCNPFNSVEYDRRKICKVLMALEQGRLAEFHGKNLDEIVINPDEKVLESDEDRSIQEGHCSSTLYEPKAEETLSPAERSEMPPPPKRQKPPSPDEEIPSAASVVRTSFKGKTTRRKNPWQQTEVQVVERHMMRFITSFTVPAKSDCEKCLKAEPEALKNRDWKNAKFFIYNRITAYKKSLQCK